MQTKFNNLFWSAAILLVCNFISRVLGFVYKIILVRLIGTSGIGVTEMTGPVYSFALVAASMGIPLAAGRLLALEIGRHNHQNLRRIQHTAMLLLLVLGSLATVICFCFAPHLLARFGSSEGAVYLRYLCPAILLVTVCSGFRAYFQATKQIGIIGISQNFEQIVRVAAGSLLVYLALPYGLEAAVKAVALATVLGEACGLLFILRAYLGQRPHNPLPPTISRADTVLRLFAFGAPVTVQRLLMSAILMLQALLIPLALQKSGLSPAAATDAYGNFSGVALSLIHLPGIFTATLAMALLPSIAESDNNPTMLNSRINQSLHITAVIALPFMLLFYRFADELCSWLFHAPAAADSLRILASAAFFIYAQTALTSILQGMGKLKALFAGLIISGGVFLAAVWLLVPIFGITGAALAELLFAATACAINYAFLRHFTALRLQVTNIIIKPLTAACFGVITAKTAETLLPAVHNFSSYANFVIICATGSAAYLLLLVWLDGLPRVFRHYLRPLFIKKAKKS